MKKKKKASGPGSLHFFPVFASRSWNVGPRGWWGEVARGSLTSPKCSAAHVPFGNVDREDDPLTSTQLSLFSPVIQFLSFAHACVALHRFSKNKPRLF
jgi:hypothetical protein